MCDNVLFDNQWISLYFQRVIDFLKMDIEWSEWAALPAIFKEGSLVKYVKQIGIEFHLDDRIYPEIIQMVNILEGLGFRKWHFDVNLYSVRKAEKRHTLNKLCYEVYFVNINFLKISWVVAEIQVANSCTQVVSTSTCIIHVS